MSSRRGRKTRKSRHQSEPEVSPTRADMEVIGEVAGGNEEPQGGLGDQGDEVAANLQHEVDQLRAELSALKRDRLRQQKLRLQAELAEVQGALLQRRQARKERSQSSPPQKSRRSPGSKDKSLNDLREDELLQDQVERRVSELQGSGRIGRRSYREQSPRKRSDSGSGERRRSTTRKHRPRSRTRHRDLSSSGSSSSGAGS